MIPKTYLLLIVSLLLSINCVIGQNDTGIIDNQAIPSTMLLNYNKIIAEIEQQRIVDSLKKVELEAQIQALQTTNYVQKEKLLLQIREIEEQEQKRISLKQQKIDSLKLTAKGYPIIGIYEDTLFHVYFKIGASIPQVRAINITNRLEKLFYDDFLKIDSIICIDAEYNIDIVYGETIIMSISEMDALWQGTTKQELAKNYTAIIQNDLRHAKDESKLSRVIVRIALLLLVLFIVAGLFWLISKYIKKLNENIELKKVRWLKQLAYKNYTILTAEQEYKAILFLLKPFRWFVFAIILYIALPIIFSIFPFTRSWADNLFYLIWEPLKGILISIWSYFPNLFTVLLIYFVMKYVIRVVKYIFREIESKKLTISGFHSDWAMHTYSIVKFLLYAFMFILIFPYLPGSDSVIFKGVSVFLGILFSLGSSTAISNIVAGLVITYMRPFIIGDRIKIGDVIGDVEEKTLLVTRIKTQKNEIITIPNSAVLSGNTTNYSSEIVNNGLILHTTVTIGYDVPWKKMHDALIDASLKTEYILHEPKPFVLQTSLDDFYVSYQINAHTKHVKIQAFIYSNLHQNIQDVCNERGIEILSPHYRAARDGNMTTIPVEYVSNDYKAPSFNIKMDSNTDT